MSDFSSSIFSLRYHLHFSSALFQHYPSKGEETMVQTVIGYVSKDDVDSLDVDPENITEKVLEENDLTLVDDYDLSTMYKEFLDEIYPEVVLGYSHFSPSEVIENLDPISYRVGRSEYESEYFYEVMGERE